MNKYLSKAFWNILFDKRIGDNEQFEYLNPMTMDKIMTSYNYLISDNYKYSGGYIGIMVAYPDNIRKVE